MGIYQNIRKIFSSNGYVKSGDVTVADHKVSSGLQQRAVYIEDHVMPYVCGENFLEMFRNLPEVFFPIDYLASRISGAKFVVKRVSDDSVVWRNKSMNRILSNPNCIMSFSEMVYLHFVYMLTTGNSYIAAAMSDAFENSPKFEMCSNFWVLPANNVTIEKPNMNVPLFGVAEKQDLICSYRLLYGGERIDYLPWKVWHDRDGSIEGFDGNWGSVGYLKAESRLKAQCRPMSNLIAVYEARNVIYVKRGGLGFLVNLQKDATGNVALQPDEVKELLEQHNEKYGLSPGKFPWGFSNAPLSFVRTNLSINELMPFDETLADAISIAGAYGIPSVLVPRKDQSTFNNQAAAEKAVYSSQIIPLANQFCEEFGQFLGLGEKGLYLSADFSHVDCLQQGMKEAEEVKQKVNERCGSQFESGLISINDWRAQIGECKLESPDFPEVFDKVKFLMSDEELKYIKRIINNQSNVENGREDQKPSVQDEGE